MDPVPHPFHVGVKQGTHMIPRLWHVNIKTHYYDNDYKSRSPLDEPHFEHCSFDNIIIHY
jgi:hypothetical protein